jgi:hypothetical protein
MDWSPLGWSLDAARFASALPWTLILKASGLALLWLAVIGWVVIWLRSPVAPSLDDEEPRHTKR